MVVKGQWQDHYHGSRIARNRQYILQTGLAPSGIWSRGWKMFTERLDKSWSLTDCISFEVMHERGVTEALAADSHFRQAGFHALLLDS
jgi:predicted nucleic acid-binding protein